jgi:hypothetical protein
VNRFFVGYQMNYADYDGSGTRELYGKNGAKLYGGSGLPATYGSDLYDRLSHSGYLGYRLTLDKESTGRPAWVFSTPLSRT